MASSAYLGKVGNTVGNVNEYEETKCGSAFNGTLAMDDK
jgi:hypothetical protein